MTQKDQCTQTKMPSKPNAYSLFVKDNFNRLRREGKNPQYSSLFKDLSQKWTSLSEAERQRYKDRAKNPQQHWNNDRGSQSNPVSHTVSDSFATNRPSSNEDPPTELKPGVNVKPFIKELSESKVFIKRSHDELDSDEDCSGPQDKKSKLGIPNHWKARGQDPERYQDIHLVKIRENCKVIISDRANKLITMPIYAFSVNVLCMKKLDDGSGIYPPIEIGICAYSIKAGRIGNVYHALIDAGPIPEGCINLASDHAEATHKITIPPKGTYPRGSRNDYRKIYREIVDYTKEGERTILVWSVREMQQVVGSLEWLYEKANQQPGPGKLPRVSTWTVLPVMEFTANMTNFVHQKMLGNKEPVFIIHYFLNMLLEISIYDYERDLMCDYHRAEHIESKWCARSCAIRMFLCIERAFEEINSGYVMATKPSFLQARMAPQPIAYHRHRPSQQYLADQTSAASGRGEATTTHESNQQLQTPPLAITAPEPASAPENGNHVMMIEDE